MNCLICHSVKSKQIYFSENACVFRCSVCKGVFCTNELSPPDPASSNDEVYSDEYFKAYKGVEKEQMRNSDDYLTLLNKYKKSGSLLDYGCGSGIFLKVANKHGFCKNVGTDISSAALKIAKGNLSDSDRLININSEKLDKEKFDVVCFIDSIAHIKNVRDIISSIIENNLNKGSLFFIRTPNINVLYIYYVRLLSKILPAKYISALYFMPNRHILFNEPSIKKFLESLGFEITYLHLHKDYARPIDRSSLIRMLKSILMLKIPGVLNPGNSMIVIAKLRSVKGA